MIGDPTEVERPQAWNTGDVGTLKDGKTKGFWALVFDSLVESETIFECVADVQELLPNEPS